MNIKVYVDPYYDGSVSIASYKGSSGLDAGLFYCPYTPGVPSIVDEFVEFWKDVERRLQQKFHHKNRLEHVM